MAGFKSSFRIPGGKSPAKTPDFKPGKFAVASIAKAGATAGKEQAREIGRATRKANRAADKMDKMPKANPFAGATKRDGAGRSTPKGSPPGKAGTGMSPLSKMFK